MKRIFIMILMLLMIFILSACAETSGTQNENIQNENIQNEKLTIITTLFPQYDFAKTIAGDTAEVSLLLDPGVEAHAYEPTPRDIVSIGQSDLFIYTGEAMEPWVADMLSSIASDNLVILDVSKNITLIKSTDHDDDAHDADEADEHEDENDHGEYDPHFWLNPQNAIIMVDNILKSLVELSPENEAVYTERAEALKADLKTLDEVFETFFDGIDNPQIIYGGHYAFAYFTNRYGVSYASPYTSFSPDAEPTPQSIANLIDVIEENNYSAIYYEELISPKVAEVVANETGAKMLLLHGAHNVSKDELESGITYISIMYDNLDRLKEGLLNE